MKIIDSGVLIGALMDADEYHAQAVALLRKHQGENLLLTQPVFQEVIEFIREHTDNQVAVQAAHRLRNANNLIMDSAQTEDIDYALTTLKKYPQLSYCDSLSAAIASRRGIREILSFDSDFDALKELRRLA